MARTEFLVEGMTCGHCVRAVTQALTDLDGVDNAAVHLDTKTAQVIYDDKKVSEEDLFNAVRAENYTPVKKK